MSAELLSFIGRMMYATGHEYEDNSSPVLGCSGYILVMSDN